MLIIGLVIIIVICFVVKLFDDEIRKSHALKAIIVYAFFASLLLIGFGIVRLFIK